MLTKWEILSIYPHPINTLQARQHSWSLCAMVIAIPCLGAAMQG